jgi:hypothetical protein
MHLKRTSILFLLPLLLLTAAFQSFEPVGTPLDPNSNITFPPPIYLLRGQVEIRGTANLAGLIGHYIEFRLLNPDFAPSAGASGWTPATEAVKAPVIDGVLGVWDTTPVDDGAYEIRLLILISGGTAISRVSPLRVENFPPPFVGIDTPEGFPPLIPPTVSTSPSASPVSVNVNVRGGDGTAYATVGSLLFGQSAAIIGRSSRGSGWWYIRLPNGRQGWVSPDVVVETGDLSGIPFVEPPPTIAPTPSLPDGTINTVRFDRAIKQGEAFQVIVTVFNDSSAPMGPVLVACNFGAQNVFVTSLAGLGAFAQIDVALTAQLNSGGGSAARALCGIDVDNRVAESNENNNFFNLTMTLLPA